MTTAAAWLNEWLEPLVPDYDEDLPDDILRHEERRASGEEREPRGEARRAEHGGAN